MTKRLMLIVTLLIFPLTVRAQIPRVGLILPLSGKAAQPGEATRNGAVMANENLGRPFELLFEDNALDSTRTIAAARKLINVDKVQGLIVYASGPSNAAAPVAEMAQVPMIGLSVDPNVPRGRKWVMIHWASNERVAERLFAELERRSLRKVALITTQVQGSLDLAELFIKKSAEKKIEIAFNEQALPSETDFLTTISRMKKTSPDAVFVNLYYGQAGIFARQCAERGFRPQFFSHFIFDDDGEVASAQGALDGAFFATTSAGDLTFDQSYAQKHGRRPVLGGISAYDIVGLFDAGFRNSSGTPQAINSYLHDVKDFKGKIGTYDALPDNSFAVPAGLGEIQHGKVVKLPE